MPQTHPTAGPPAALQRRLGLPGAIVIGVGSMVGAGVFTSLGLAASTAGPLLVLALVLAGATAWVNATAMAQLAAVHPTSGGAYVYGRRQLGEWAGFVAGWGFVTGKSASIAAMAYTLALYLVPTASGAPDRTARWVAIAAVVVITGITLLGITRTVQATVVIVTPVLALLTVVIVAGFVGVTPGPVPAPGGGPSGAVTDPTPLGVLQGAGLLFFAFAGYARIATMGEEVRDPRRTIPRAVFGALAFTLVLYLLLALSLQAVLGLQGLGQTPTAVRDAVEVVLGPDWVWLAVVGAALACLGSMLNLAAGISRTGLAMARERDLPRPLARISARTSVPWVAQLTAAAVVIVLLLTTDVLTVVGFSSFGVLVYYAVANVSALTLTERVVPGPRWLNLLGAAACLLLAFTLPVQSVLVMLAVFAVGLAGRAVVGLRRR
ncbi:APC family permease [Micrococcus sp. TA1]|uniref:APC family permease n=1 Tax=Micrococcus sp. TA1 TaxID=681627 RepID=UPI001622C3BA|nr:APC family permease [Micrococcus sp. TA1]MBB5749103.1 APA family basic amino acid/polyamine antiporter [Micrococcus sp. TA1]